ncbi:hypothetical protein [Pseudomonas canadensis]|uniref:hypothetical protein n=1 Tax=Pseudomonas canadensis TaxID=915099 RepID=UPI002811F4D8|nr:hypothetical protein [Pseudomonas canadensis]
MAVNIKKKIDGKLLLLAVGLLLVVVVVQLVIIVTYRASVKADDSTVQQVETPKLGIHCANGKASNTSHITGGFLRTEPVIIDGEFVDCAMKFIVKNKELTLEELYVRFLTNNHET